MNRHMYFRQQEKNYLAHHGIKGQKWGVRRYQNEDGTLTEEGRKRYGLSVEKDDKLSNANLKKRTKALQKESVKIHRRLGDAQADLAEELASTKEYEDRKKWSNNKKFKEDVKKEVEQYLKTEDDFYIRSEKADEIEERLKRKYPEATKLLEGMSLHEHDHMPLNEIFTDATDEYEGTDGNRYYGSWLDNILNNDFYYEPSDFYDEAWTTISASKAEINNELAKKYGQDAVDEILKKGYSSLV